METDRHRPVATGHETRSRDVRIDVLGPLRAVVDGRPVDLGSPKQRVVLAVLVSACGRPVPVDRVIDLVWPEGPPVRARHSVQQYMSRLRAAVEPGRPPGRDPTVLCTEAGGYSLALDADLVDMRRFVRDATAGRDAIRAGDTRAAVQHWRDALVHWQGPAFADLRGEPFADAEAARLDELRLFTVESRIAAEIDLGQGADLVPELHELVQAQPLREEFWGQLMVCLYRAGRQADALNAYQRVRSLLADQLGLDPGAGLQELEAAILAGSLATPGASALAVSASTPTPAPRAAADPAVDCWLAPGERRTTVVVNAELTDLEPFRSTTDDRTVELLVDEVRRRVGTAIVELAGSVVRSTGSATVGLFGIPAAAENDAARAVQCAVRCAAELDALAADVAESWSVAAPAPRVAVCCAEVEGGVVEPLPGSVGRRCGELAAAGPPGAAIVTDDVRGLVEPLFHWGARIPRHPASIAVRNTSGPGRMQGLPGMAAPLLGREEPLATAREWLNALRQGRGGVLFVEGEAGIGKTRLVEELRRSARTAAPEPLWLAAGCEPHGDRVPYRPFRQLVRGWLGSTPLDELRVKVAARRQLDQLPGVEPATVLPVLLMLAGVAGGGPDSEQIAQLNPESVQRNIAAALTSLLGALAADRPIVVAVDDLHWADHPSLDLLEHLLAELAGRSIGFLLAARPEPDHRSWGVRETAMRRMPHRSSAVALGPLRGGIDLDLLRALIGDGGLPHDVERSIVESADGNPFFLEEVVRSLITSGALTNEVDGWRLRGRATVDVPPTVERLIVSRLDVLPPTHRAVLGAASVLGRTFSAGLLAQVSAPDCDGDLGEIVERLQRIAMLEELRRWPTHELRFNHALTVEAIYQSLTATRQAELHERAARAIESGLREDDSAAFAPLARHWERAGNVVSAAEYHRLAGDHALRVHALELARREFQAGLDLSGRGDLPPTTVAALTYGLGTALRQGGEPDRARPVLREAERLAAAADAPTIRLAALEGLGVVEETGASKRLAIGYYEQAAALAAQVGDTGREMSLHNRLAVVAASQLRFADAHASARRALAIADRLGDPQLSARAIDGAKLVAWYLGDLDELERLATAAEPDLHADGEWYLQFVLLESASVSAARGHWAVALERIEEGLALNDRIGNRAERPLLLALAARLHRWRGRLGAAWQLCTDARELAKEVGADWMLSWARTEQGALLLELGAPGQAIPHLQEGRRIAQACSAQTVELWAVGHLCLATRLTDDDRAATLLVQDMSDLTDLVTVPAGRAFLGAEDALASYTEAALALGDPSPAHTVLEPLLDAATRAGHLPAQARASLVLAGADRTAGYVGRARHRLLRARDSAAAGDLTLLGFNAVSALAASTEGTEQAAHRAAAARYRDELLRHRPDGPLGDHLLAGRPEPGR